MSNSSEYINDTQLITELITDPIVKPRKKYSKFPVDKALKMRLKGRTYTEIGEAIGQDKANVYRALKPFMTGCPQIVEQVESIREVEAELLDVKRYELLSELTTDKIKGMSGKDICISAGILTDKSRLSRNLSTNNVSLYISSARKDAGDLD